MKDVRYWYPEAGDEDWNKEGIKDQPASKEAIDYIMNLPIGNDSGKSEWRFIRMPDGTLVFGCYPKGDDYLMTEKWRNIRPGS